MSSEKHSESTSFDLMVTFPRKNLVSCQCLVNRFHVVKVDKYPVKVSIVVSFHSSDVVAVVRGTVDIPGTETFLRQTTMNAIEIRLPSKSITRQNGAVSRPRC